MPPTRFPSLAHWGAFTALVENGRLVGCEPFARDPAPSDMLAAMPEMVHSPLRVARPAIREGWREGKPRTGAERYREVSWDEALDTVAGEIKRVREAHGNTRSSAAPTAGRRPGACTMRAAWCAASCFSAAAASTRSPTTASAPPPIFFRA